MRYCEDMRQVQTQIRLEGEGEGRCRLACRRTKVLKMRVRWVDGPSTWAPFGMSKMAGPPNRRVMLWRGGGVSNRAWQERR